MIDTIYVEADADEEPRARRLLRRFANATVIRCESYTEVFNPAAQSFRLQKRRPALILARKHGHHVLEAPEGFGIGTPHNFYFSHLLNCLYDCRYCFLQGMFRSAHYVFFVNFEAFQNAIDDALAGTYGEPCTFFSGYDCDSLALESLTGFATEFIPFFAARPQALLELRTKSVAIRPLLQLSPARNIVAAFSFTPSAAATRLEHGAPPVGARIEAMAQLADAGWPVALRLDPLLWYEGWQRDYRRLVRDLAAAVPAAALHSVSIGPLRFPRGMFHRIEGMYPEEALFAGPLRRRGSLTSYGDDREEALSGLVREELAKAYPSAPVYSCIPAS